MDAEINEITEIEDYKELPEARLENDNEQPEEPVTFQEQWRRALINLEDLDPCFERLAETVPSLLEELILQMDIETDNEQQPEELYTLQKE